MKVKMNTFVSNEVVSFKFVSSEVCCPHIKLLPIEAFCIENNRDLTLNIQAEAFDGDAKKFRPVFVLRYNTEGEDGFDDCQSFEACYCPCCGAKLEIEVLAVIDVAKEVCDLRQQVRELRVKKQRCQTKDARFVRIVHELNTKVRELNNYQCDDHNFYEVNDYANQENSFSTAQN